MGLDNDEYFMQKCVEIAKAYINPDRNKAIGALVVKDDKIVGEGYRKTIVFQEAPLRDYTIHAEHMAIIMAGDKTEGATLYTTLEPCFSRYKGVFCNSPPKRCCELIAEAKIKWVVIGAYDHDFGGGGIDYLESKDIQVRVLDWEFLNAFVENDTFPSSEVEKTYKKEMRK
jgi:diaminohydroxyphosphoribosylaminopyrimidine deaminase/5-amino-6-(5-phosphoribosylamino)uracil reductase